MAALILHGIGIALVGLTPASLLLMGMTAGFVAAVGGSIFNGASLALLQAKVPLEIQGQVFSLSLSSATAMAPIGLAVAGPVTDTLGPQSWFVVAGTVLTAAGVGGFFVPPLMRIEDWCAEKDGSEVVHGKIANLPGE